MKSACSASSEAMIRPDNAAVEAQGHTNKQPNSPCVLMSLPQLVLEKIIGHADSDSRHQLRQVSKDLHQAVLQHAPTLTLFVGHLDSDRSYSEAKAVVRRARQIARLTFRVADDSAMPKALRLLSELATDFTEYPHLCAVSTLVVKTNRPSAGDLLTQLGSAFPMARTLDLRFKGDKYGRMSLSRGFMQGLAAFRRLERLLLRSCDLGGGMTVEQVSHWLTHVKQLGVVLDKVDGSFLLALAPQLTHLKAYTTYGIWSEEDERRRVSSSLFADPAALCACTQLVEVHLPRIHQASLDALLGLPCLERVSCMHWYADARDRKCTWSRFSCTTLKDGDNIRTLPHGIQTLCLEPPQLHIQDTEELCFHSSNAYAQAVVSMCSQVSWIDSCDKVPSFSLDTYVIPPEKQGHIKATLEGLAPLTRFPGATIHFFPLRLPLSRSLLEALSPASAFLQHLELCCPTVEAEAWEALPSMLPATSRCTIQVEGVSAESVAALGALCRSPGCAVAQVMVRVQKGMQRGYTQSVQQLAQLQAELEASGAPVGLRVM